MGTVFRILLVLSLYILVLAIVYLWKPSIFFNEQNDLKDVGFTDEGRSIVSLYYITPIIVLFLYIIVLALWKISF